MVSASLMMGGIVTRPKPRWGRRKQAHMTISEQLHRSKFHRAGYDPNCPQCAGIAILASFLDGHGITARDAEAMSAEQFTITANLARLQTTPDRPAVIANLAGRQSRRQEATQDFREQLARLERETR